jgi:uncharacterized protein (TIGR03435 family)
MMVRVLTLALTAASLFAQTGFDAVSIHPADLSATGSSIHGGPGSPDPGFVTMRNIDLFSLVAMAYGLHRYELSAPGWLNSTSIDLSARLPQGIDADQYRRMLQVMLGERFHLAVHHETHEMRVYDLTVDKNGPKIKESTNPSTPSAGVRPPPKAGPRQGYHGPVMIDSNGLFMPVLAALLSRSLEAPVIDATGLTGEYEIHLRGLIGIPAPARDDENPPPTLFDALPQQLGLRLVPRKAQVDIVVVDRMDKSPTQN